MKKKLLIVIGVSLLILVLGFIFSQRSEAPGTKTDSKQPATNDKQNKSNEDFDKSAHSLTDPTSIWVIVNKQHQLEPQTYAPDDLVTPSVALRVPGNESMNIRKSTAEALQNMFVAAGKRGINLMLSSGYRSYAYQTSLYGGYVNSLGQADADKQSARPGYSEHQTGLAVDIRPLAGNCDLMECFANTPEGKWLARNAHKFGFTLRYPKKKTAITGYNFEPWHFRYVGKDFAAELYTKQQTLEEFFDIKGGESY